jgi:eukaryotic-like serine/threonine-protein kinase
LLSGRLPYEASSLSELALKQQRESPIPLQRLNPQVPAELAEAIAIAVDIDPVHRPADAAEFGDLVRDGAAGISPYEDDEGATRQLGATASTQLLPAGEPQTAATRMAPVSRPVTSGGTRAPRAAPARSRQAAPPRQVPARRQPTVEAEAPRRRRRGRRLLRRVIFTLVLLCLIAAGAAIAAIEIANKSNQTVVHYKQVVAKDAQDAIQSVQQLVDKYTSSK